ncbi:hypothetical protein D3C76_591380 [compost metagenome]
MPLTRQVVLQPAIFSLDHRISRIQILRPSIQHHIDRRFADRLAHHAANSSVHGLLALGIQLAEPPRRAQVVRHDLSMFDPKRMQQKRYCHTRAVLAGNAVNQYRGLWHRK